MHVKSFCIAMRLRIWPFSGKNPTSRLAKSHGAKFPPYLGHNSSDTVGGFLPIGLFGDWTDIRIDSRPTFYIRPELTAWMRMLSRCTSSLRSFTDGFGN